VSRMKEGCFRLSGTIAVDGIEIFVNRAVQCPTIVRMKSKFIMNCHQHLPFGHV
jgi:hypothetical protein